MLVAVLSLGNLLVMARCIVVVDSLTRSPLPGASVFNRKGVFIGASRPDGSLSCVSKVELPVTVRYMGYFEKTVTDLATDTVPLSENIAELPEVIVETKHQKALHILAYVREYSTLSSYTDTVTMFREKMVDYMIPDDSKSRFKGWTTPRTLNSRSYYQFTNANGLDSVSDRCNYHFSWSDWIGLPRAVKCPVELKSCAQGRDTIAGDYGPAEIWLKTDDRLSVDADMISGADIHKWAPRVANFKNSNTDFDQFRLRFNFDNVADSVVTPLELTGYSFNVESRGRGREMFKFNRLDRPFFVSTYAEVYLLDKEFISIKEAKKWDKREFSSDEIVILEPEEAPDLQLPTLALINRVNRINSSQVRVSIEPDRRLMSRHVVKHNFQFGHRALSMLKQLTGITYLRSHRNFNKNWKEFIKKQVDLNKQSDASSGK